MGDPVEGGSAAIAAVAVSCYLLLLSSLPLTSLPFTFGLNRIPAIYNGPTSRMEATKSPVYSTLSPSLLHPSTALHSSTALQLYSSTVFYRVPALQIQLRLLIVLQPRLQLQLLSSTTTATVTATFPAFFRFSNFISPAPLVKVCGASKMAAM